MEAKLRSYVQALALVACGKHADGVVVTAEGATGEPRSNRITYTDDAPAEAVLAAIARADVDPLEIRDKDGVVCTRVRRPTQPVQGQVYLSVRISATEWITKLTVGEEDLIDPPFDAFAQIIDVYRRSPLFTGVTDAELAAQPGTLANTLTPALRTLCAAFPGIRAVRPDELIAKPTFGDTNTAPPQPRETKLAIGIPTVEGPMTPAIVRRYLVHEVALLEACQLSATIRFAVDTDGKTTEVVADPCLANALAAVHFPAPPAPVKITVPLTYRRP